MENFCTVKSLSKCPRYRIRPRFRHLQRNRSVAALCYLLNNTGDNYVQSKFEFPDWNAQFFFYYYFQKNTKSLEHDSSSSFRIFFGECFHNVVYFDILGSIILNAKRERPLSFSCAMVDLKVTFDELQLKKDHSALAIVTGSVKNKARKFEHFPKKMSSWLN